MAILFRAPDCFNADKVLKLSSTLCSFFLGVVFDELTELKFAAPIRW